MERSIPLEGTIILAAEAERERNERQAIVGGLNKQLARRQSADRQFRLPPLPAPDAERERQARL